MNTLGWRENCRCCGRISPVGFYVPDKIWLMSLPQRFRDTVLCIICFAMFSDEAGIDWAKEIEFYPVSLIAHQEHAKKCIQEEEPGT